MAYFSIGASDAAGIVSEIISFAQLNGWTYADTILDADSYYLKLTGASTTVTGVVGVGKVGSTLTTPYPPTGTFNVLSSLTFPVVLHMFAHATPSRSLYVIVKRPDNTYSHLHFCNLTKFGTQQGNGQYFSGSFYTDQGLGSGLNWFTDSINDVNSVLQLYGDNLSQLNYEIASINSSLNTPIWAARRIGLPADNNTNHYTPLGMRPNVRRSSIRYIANESDIAIDGNVYMVIGTSPATVSNAYAYRK